MLVGIQRAPPVARTPHVRRAPLYTTQRRGHAGTLGVAGRPRRRCAARWSAAWQRAVGMMYHRPQAVGGHTTIAEPFGESHVGYADSPGHATVSGGIITYSACWGRCPARLTF